MHTQFPADILQCIPMSTVENQGDRVFDERKDDFTQMMEEHVRIKKTLLVFILKFLLQTTYMIEIKNPDGTWPMRLELKFCAYQSPHIKSWTIDVCDTVGKICI